MLQADRWCLQAGESGMEREKELTGTDIDMTHESHDLSIPLYYNEGCNGVRIALSAATRPAANPACTEKESKARREGVANPREELFT